MVSTQAKFAYLKLKMGLLNYSRKDFGQDLEKPRTKNVCRVVNAEEAWCPSLVYITNAENRKHNMKTLLSGSLEDGMNQMKRNMSAIIKNPVPTCRNNGYILSEAMNSDEVASNVLSSVIGGNDSYRTPEPRFPSIVNPRRPLPLLNPRPIMGGTDPVLMKRIFFVLTRESQGQGHQS